MHTVYSQRIVVAEDQVVWLPQDYRPSAQASNPYGVVYCHGNGDFAVSPLNISGKLGQYRLVEAIVNAGFPLLSMDLGQTGVTPNGVNGWGNATNTARLASAFTHVTGATVGAKTGKVILVGVSMGNITAMNYAKANPTKVAGIFGAIPVADIDAIYQDNTAGLRAGIGTAHGVTYPTALPADVNPATSPGSLSSVPTRLSYSTADTTCLPATVTALAALIGATAVVHSASLDHSEASLQAIDLPALVAWMASLT